MAYIVKAENQKFKLGKRAFNTLTQATSYIKDSVKNYLKGGYLRLFSEGVENSADMIYKAIFIDIYGRANVVKWRILEA